MHSIICVCVYWFISLVFYLSLIGFYGHEKRILNGESSHILRAHIVLGFSMGISATQRQSIYSNGEQWKTHTRRRLHYFYPTHTRWTKRALHTPSCLESIPSGGEEGAAPFKRYTHLKPFLTFSIGSFGYTHREASDLRQGREQE